MHIVVCVKQTPVGTDVKVDEKTGCLIRSGVESGINPFDEFAVEEALRLKEKNPGSTVSALTMGPQQADTVLKEAVARGCDKIYHISGREFAGSDTWATSYALSQAVKKIASEKPVDLVICGKQTNDSDTGHIGPQMASWLDWPNAAFVRKVESVTNNVMRVHRLMEDGYDVIDLPFPAVISVIKEINTPRIASLRGRLAAKKAVAAVWTAADIGCDEAHLGSHSPTSVVKCFAPKHEYHAVTVGGNTPAEKAAKLLELLKEAQQIQL